MEILLLLKLLCGGVCCPPPRKKALENRHRVEMYVHKPIYQGQLIAKKIRPITVIVWALERGEKNA